MKIAFLGPAYPFRGGIVQFIEMMADQLAKREQVKIFSFQKQYPKIIFPGKKQIDHSRKKPDLEIENVFIPYDPFSWQKAIRKIRKWQPDILVLKYWIPFFAPAFGVIIRALKRKIRLKVIYVIDNIQFHEKWFAGELLTKFALGKADVLITLSYSVYQDTKALFPQKKIVKGFHPIYNCYDKGYFSKKSAREKLGVGKTKNILFFGYIKPYKGLDILLRAMPFLIKKMPDIHLIIAGEVYGKDDIYLDLIDKLQLKKYVTFLKRFVQDEEVEMLYKAADVLALPYKHATQSGVMQIALDIGLGAVATPVGGLPEIVLQDRTGKIARSTKPEDFAEAVIAYFQMDMEKLAHNLAFEKQKYSWESFISLIY